MWTCGRQLLPAVDWLARGDTSFRQPHTPPQFRSTSRVQIPSIARKIGTALRRSLPFISNTIPVCSEELQVLRMADTLDYVKICESCPPGDGWGPSVTSETTLNGVPYAPFSKGDKLGRMADWTTEGKDRDRGRAQYNRNYRGEHLVVGRAGDSCSDLTAANSFCHLLFFCRPTSLRC